jgi:hypothetical protein
VSSSPRTAPEVAVTRHSAAQHAMTLGISSRSFSSLSIASRRHVPWMCPGGPQPVAPRFELAPDRVVVRTGLDACTRGRTATEDDHLRSKR